MSGGIFVGMDKNIMDGLNAVLEGQSSTYGTLISVIIISSFTLFITYRGYQTLGGKLQTPVEDVVWDVGRMLLITTFVLNRDGWLNAIIVAIEGLKDGISGDDNVWALLDTVWEKAQALGPTLFNLDTSTYVKVNGGFAEVLVWGGAIVLLLAATFVNLLAEITILLMTTTAPLFIFCLLYGFLKRKCGQIPGPSGVNLCIHTRTGFGPSNSITGTERKPPLSSWSWDILPQNSWAVGFGFMKRRAIYPGN